MPREVCSSPRTPCGERQQSCDPVDRPDAWRRTTTCKSCSRWPSFSLSCTLSLCFTSTTQSDSFGCRLVTQRRRCAERETKQRPSQRDAKIRQRSAELNNAERAAPPCSTTRRHFRSANPGACGQPPWSLRPAYPHASASLCVACTHARRRALPPPCAARRARRARPRANKAVGETHLSWSREARI